MSDLRKVSKLVTLDLSNLNGNAFVLMSAFKNNAKRQGIKQEEISDVINDCMSDDYDHLLQVLLANTED